MPRAFFNKVSWIELKIFHSTVKYPHSKLKFPIRYSTYSSELKEVFLEFTDLH